MSTSHGHPLFSIGLARGPAVHSWILEIQTTRRIIYFGLFIFRHWRAHDGNTAAQCSVLTINLKTIVLPEPYTEHMTDFNRPLSSNHKAPWVIDDDNSIVMGL